MGAYTHGTTNNSPNTNYDPYAYSPEYLENYPSEHIKYLYEHYRDAGQLSQHPELAERYHFVYRGDAPDVRTYNIDRRETPSTKWDKQAEDGYEVEPAELRRLASALESDLNELKRHLNKIRGHTGFTAEGAGGGTNGQKMATLANSASQGFGEYYSAIQTGIQGVIQRLRTTADNYESGHQQTESAVNNNVDV